MHEVQKAGEEMVKEFEEKAEVKLSQKMNTYEENRQNQLKGMLNKLKEHVSWKYSELKVKVLLI